MAQMSLFGPAESAPEPKPAGDQVVRHKVLVTVKAAPNPSDKYGETVCVAGVSADLDQPKWIRLYPINFRELGGEATFSKYDIVSVDAVPARQDPRRESWRPRMDSFRVEQRLRGWGVRRPWIEPYLHDDVSMCSLLRGAREGADAASLALVRPKQVTAFKIEPHPGWTALEQAKIDFHARQFDLFGNADRTPLQAPRFRAKYHYLCRERSCSGHRQGLLDWEFVALQRRTRHLESRAAVARLTGKFLDEICAPHRDVGFYVGNQAKRAHVFSVLGVYWPPR